MRKIILWINILFILLLFEITFPIVMKKYNFMTLSRYDIITQDEFNLKSAHTIFDYPDSYNKNFINLIKDKIDLKLDSEKTIETAIKIREQLLNLAERQDTTNLISRYPDKLLNHMLSNKSLLCGEIARLYGYILHLSGFYVRYITISRSIFDEFDRHSTIEIWDEKRQKWIISDPTFNITFQSDSNFLSSDEVYDLIHSGYFNSIKIIKGNPTKYELHIDNYHISIFSLFDNVFFIKNIHQFNLAEFPPIRWLNDKFKIYLLQSNKFPVFGTGIKIQNSIMFFVLFLFPVMIVAITTYLSYLLLREKYSSQIISLNPKPILVKVSKKFYL